MSSDEQRCLRDPYRNTCRVLLSIHPDCLAFTAVGKVGVSVLSLRYYVEIEEFREWPSTMCVQQMPNFNKR